MTASLNERRTELSKPSITFQYQGFVLQRFFYIFMLNYHQKIELKRENIFAEL